MKVESLVEKMVDRWAGWMVVKRVKQKVVW